MEQFAKGKYLEFAYFRYPIKELVEPSAVINLCIRKRDPTAAIRYAQNFPHAEVLFCSIILEFGKKRDLVSSLKAFDASKQKMSSPNMHAYRTIIDVCGLCGDYLKSRAIYEGLRAGNTIPNTYVFNSLMNVNSRDLNYTLVIYREMEVRFIVFLLSLCFEPFGCMRLSMEMCLFQTFIHAGEFNLLSPFTWLYSLLTLHQYTHFNKCHIQKLGVMADITSHNILLKSCCLASKVDLARDIYVKIRDLESKGILKLDVFTYSTIFKVFADAKMWKQALEIKEDMVSSGVAPNKVTWSSLISACANAGLVEKAIILFDEMLQAGCQPNTQCFNTLLHACVEACQFDRAFRLFECWKDGALQKTIPNDNNLNSADKLAAVTQMTVPLRSYSHLTAGVPFIPSTSTYNTMMKACGTDYRRAKALMDEMKTFGLSPNQITWSILVDIRGSSGNVQGAVQILRSMHESGIQPDVIAYTTAIKICVRHKNPKLAFMLFEEMKKYQIKPNKVTYDTILSARSVYGSLSEVQQCLEVYQHMRNAGFKPNDYYLKQLIEEWCEGVIQTDQRNKGQFALQVTDFGHPSLLLEKVAEHLQEDNAERLSIDLRGLTKVEARIVVLAVLRRIKERCIKGNSIKDDLVIILGHLALGSHVTEDESGVREAVLRLLQHDLGLQVSAMGSSTTNDTSRDKGYRIPTSLNAEVDERSSFEQIPESLTRRPVVLQRLNVTRESLHHWLLRTGSSRR